MTLNPVAIAPIIRILLRYAVGFVFGTELANVLSGDPDVVMALATLVAIGTESAYTYAKKKGLST